MLCKQKNFKFQCIFKDEIIFEKVGLFSLQIFDLLVWVLKIYPYAHPLLQTPLAGMIVLLNLLIKLILLV